MSQGFPMAIAHCLPGSRPGRPSLLTADCCLRFNRRCPSEGRCPPDLSLKFSLVAHRDLEFIGVLYPWLLVIMYPFSLSMMIPEASPGFMFAFRISRFEIYQKVVAEKSLNSSNGSPSVRSLAAAVVVAAILLW